MNNKSGLLFKIQTFMTETEIVRVIGPRYETHYWALLLVQKVILLTELNIIKLLIIQDYFHTMWQKWKTILPISPRVYVV